MTKYNPENERIKRQYFAYLKEAKRHSDPLFPATRIVVGQTRQFEVAGLEKAHWSNAEPIRKVFREAFERAGLPYFNPYSLRETLVRIAKEVCQSPEQFKAWSQNLGHEQVLTTFFSCGAVACDRQGEILRGLAMPQQATPSGANEIAEAVFQRFRNSGVNIPAQ
ncbi:MAG: hypothetical protein ACLQMO_10630 [Acidobacteriaceae bacterium]